VGGELVEKGVGRVNGRFQYLPPVLLIVVQALVHEFWLPFPEN
jgi:hypothetical protein